MTELANNFTQLIKYFTSNEKPVTKDEFKAFWESCTTEERHYFRWVNLTTGLMPMVWN